MSATDGDAGVSLSDMIAQLRLELGAAMGAGDGQRLRFIPESVELELKLSVTREGKGKAGIKFWVVDAGVEGGRRNTREQTMKLKLLPRDVSGGDAPGDDGLPGKAPVIAREQQQQRK